MKKQIQKSIIFVLYLSFLGPILTVFASSKVYAAPATCYTSNGGLSVAPTTQSCVALREGNVGLSYRNANGATSNTPTDNLCYSAPPAVREDAGVMTRNFVEAPCADLNTLLVASRQALCSASGGSWTTYAGGGAPRADCSCGTGRTLSLTTYQCATPPPTPIPDNTIETVNGPEVDCVSEGGTGDLNGDNCKIVELLNTVFNLVSGGIALAVIGNIIVAGIQYSTAQGDPSAAGKAKNRIRGALIAFLMYLGLYAFLQWLIPGGVF